MDGEQKYFGLTKMQIGILAGLAAVFCVILGVGSLFIFRNTTSASLITSEPSIAPTVTSVLITTPTITPTITLTPVPYEQLIPAGWKQYKTSLVEIWMPGNFKLADKRTKDTTVNFGVRDLLLSEVTSKSSAYTMLVSVSYDLSTGASLDAVLDEKFPTIPYQAHIADRRTVFVNTKEARRVVIEFKVENIDYNNLVFIIQDGSTIWYVAYVAQISEFFDNLPVFEQSIKTFRPATY